MISKELIGLISPQLNLAANKRLLSVICFLTSFDLLLSLSDLVSHSILEINKLILMSEICIR